jgi:hypothetical protein
LILALFGVFFFSHERVWAAISERTEGDYEVVLGGNTNRNQINLEDRFAKIVNAISNNSPTKVQQS